MSTIPDYADSIIDDDGSKLDRNKVKYATIRTDLTDPIHSFVTSNLEQANFSATAAPINTTHHAGTGYGVGSLWVDVTNDRAYINVDATTSNGVWTPLAPDYQEGTFTAVVADAASGGNAGTHSGPAARYTKIGRMVFCDIELGNIDTSGMTAGNDLFIRDLPFTRNSNMTGSEGSISADTLTFSGHLTVEVAANSTHLRIVETTSGNVRDFVTVGEVSSGATDLVISVAYWV